MKWLRIFCLCIVSTLSFRTEQSYALTLWPEYQTLSEDETVDFFNPNQVDGEYESDVWAYEPLVSARSSAVSTQSAQALLSVGSLGAKHFFLRESLAARFHILDELSLLFLNFRNDDFEDHSGATIFEFEYLKPGQEFGAALYGEAQFLKRRDDVGLALLHRSSNGRNTRIYLTAVDFSRNQRNTDQDELLNEPYVLGIKSTREVSAADTSELHIKSEGRARWRRPQEDRIYIYEKYELSYLHKQPCLGLLCRVGVSVDQKIEGESPDDGASLVVPTKWVRQRRIADISVTQGSWEGGLWLSQREWSLNHDRLSMLATQPYLRQQIEAFASEELKWQVEYSLVSTDFDGKLAGLQSPSSRVDYRLNIRSQWTPRENFLLTFLFSFDGDRFFSSECWEGGNIQLAAQF